MDDVDSESKQVLYNLWLRAVFFVYFKFAPYPCACWCVASSCACVGSVLQSLLCCFLLACRAVWQAVLACVGSARVLAGA